MQHRKRLYRAEAHGNGSWAARQGTAIFTFGLGPDFGIAVTMYDDQVGVQTARIELINGLVKKWPTMRIADISYCNGRIVINIPDNVFKDAVLHRLGGNNNEKD